MFIFELIVLILSILAGLYSFRSWWMASNEPARILADGSLELRYNQNSLWLGLLSVLFGAFLLLLSSFANEIAKDGNSVLMMGLVLVFAGSWFIYEYSVNKIIVNNRFVKKKGIFGEETIIDWLRLETVRFSPQSSYFILESMEGDTIKVNRLMRGFDEFEEILNRKAPKGNFDEESMEDYEEMVELEEKIYENLFGNDTKDEATIHEGRK